MNVNNAKVSYGTPLWEVLYGMKQKEPGDGESILDGNSDKVTLSPKSQALLGDIQAYEKSAADNTNSLYDKSGAATQSGQMGSAMDTGSMEAMLEDQLKQLKSEIQEVQSKNLPDEEKVRELGGLQSQLSVTMQQLTRLKLKV